MIMIMTAEYQICGCTVVENIINAACCVTLTALFSGIKKGTLSQVAAFPSWIDE